MTTDSSSAILLHQTFPILRQKWSRFRVKRAWLFGSRTTGGAAARSDWDFLVEFAQPPDFDAFMGLKSSLEQELKGHVDLLSRSACTPRFLQAIESDLIDVT
ncbi:MAG: nucleotidyltransferase family protein [Bryobacteraceae bacterium]